MFTQYWPSSLGMTSATFVLLLAMFFMNACGVQLYGRMEWVFKWLKIALLLGCIILMILIRAGVGPGKVDGNYAISPGFRPTGFLAGDQPAIGGTGGRILMVWTCTTMAMFQFMGGEMTLVTSGEAKRPMHDLPIAARYMYLLPISFYLVAILFLGLNVNYLDPRLYHSHIENLGASRLKGVQTAAISPFVIAIEDAGIKALPGFLDACFLFSALTAANSALKTIGRTNNGHTPLAAIIVSFIPGTLAFLGIRVGERAFKEPIHVFGRLYTGPVLCIYAAECLAFLRFLAALVEHLLTFKHLPSRHILTEATIPPILPRSKSASLFLCNLRNSQLTYPPRIKFYKRTIDRDSPFYRLRHYRAHWQPLWAILGFTLCTLLMLFSGWSAIYDLCVKSAAVDWRDSVVDLVASYLGPILFALILIIYKLVKKTTLRDMNDMRDVWFVKDVPDEDDEKNAPKTRPRNRFWEFLSWVR
ncbi:hypothetical protein Q9189_006534 [Teloschistes chrysophthalmus]